MRKCFLRYHVDDDLWLFLDHQIGGLLLESLKGIELFLLLSYPRSFGIFLIQELETARPGPIYWIKAIIVGAIVASLLDGAGRVPRALHDNDLLMLACKITASL